MLKKNEGKITGKKKNARERNLVVKGIEDEDEAALTTFTQKQSF
jgi:hypothetical protein